MLQDIHSTVLAIQTLLYELLVEMRPDSSNEFLLFKQILAECDTLTTPLPVYGHVPHANRRYDTERRSKQACATTAYSSFCVEAFAITKVSRLPPRVRNWLV